MSSPARPWLRPPRLRTLDDEAEETQRRASWLELFFDLVFVVAIAQLAQQLVRDHTLGGFAIFCGLFLAVFIAWQGFSFYADRFDTDDVLFRAAMLAGMLAILLLAGQIRDVAEGRRDVGFVLAYVALRSLVVLLYLRARRHAPRARPLIDRYAGGYGASVVVWLLSLLVDPPWRYLMWGGALTLEYLMPVFAQRLHERIPINPSHVRERFALFTMIVLGESIVAVALGTSEQSWSARSALTAALGFLLVAGLWWVYFDGGVEAGFSARAGAAQLYTRVHIPLLLALTAVGAGLHMLVLPSQAHTVGAGPAWAFDGGATLYLLCLTVNQGLTEHGPSARVRFARLGCGVLLVACAAQSAWISALLLGALSATCMTSLVLYEIRQNLLASPDAARLA